MARFCSAAVGNFHSAVDIERLAAAGASRTFIEVERQALEEKRGFEQPPAALQRWHIDVLYIKISGTFYSL